MLNFLELGNERELESMMDEKATALHLGNLGAKLTKLTPAQAAYINVPLEVLYKLPHHKY
jgi:adenosylhomocysteinase